MPRFQSFLFPLLVFFLQSCVSSRERDSFELRVLQERQLAGPDYTAVYHGFLRALAAEGYTVHESEETSGVIAASKGFTEGELEAFIDFDRSAGQGGATVRVTIQKTEDFHLEGRRGEEILDAAPYTRLFGRASIFANRPLKPSQ